MTAIRRRSQRSIPRDWVTGNRRVKRNFYAFARKGLFVLFDDILRQRSESFSARQTGATACIPKIWQRHASSVELCLFFAAR